MSGPGLLVIYHVASLPLSGEHVLLGVLGTISLGSFHSQETETVRRNKIMRYSSVIFYHVNVLRIFA